METPQNTQEQLLTIDEMASELKVPKSWIYSRTRHGKGAIPHIKVGNYLRFKKSEVIEFFDKQTSL